MMAVTRELRDSALAPKKPEAGRTPVRCTWTETDGCSEVMGSLIAHHQPGKCPEAADSDGMGSQWDGNMGSWEVCSVLVWTW
jgi:hypothetical protein